MNNSNKLKNSSSNPLNHGTLVTHNQKYLFCFHSPPWSSSSACDIEPSGHFKIPPKTFGIILQSKPGHNKNHCLVLWTNGFGWTDDQHLKIISNNDINIT
jgi:hypothetical protein